LQHQLGTVKENLGKNAKRSRKKRSVSVQTGTAPGPERDRSPATVLGILKQWADEGAPEGNSPDRPTQPRFSSDWQLGPPDLVVAMPRNYQLRAEGPDVYRNFVVPLPLTQNHYVRAVEFRPGNSKIVHHVFINLDRTLQSRVLEGEDGQPGFGGLEVPPEIPDGLLLGWQPGRMPLPFPEGMAFRIEPGNDLLFQMHLSPSGKVEELQSSIGLYFTEQPPTKTCFRLELTTYSIDIPAGATNYLVEDNVTLPVDTQLIAILPHAHYLAEQMEGWADRPDGTRQSLIWIKHWDFNWQTDYRYAQPVRLPIPKTRRPTAISVLFWRRQAMRRRRRRTSKKPFD
jgi:hypothetical protein